MMKQLNSLGTEKTSPENTDILPIQQLDGITRHITRANFLAGIANEIANAEYFDYLCFLAHFTGSNGSSNFTDIKGASITKFGNASISTAQSKFNNASLFLDGSGDYLSIAYNSDLDINSGDFRLECWYYPKTITGFITILAQWRQSTNQGGFILNTSGSTVQFHFGAINNTNPVLSGGTLSLNTWHHIAVTRIGSNFVLWLNGVAVSKTSSSNSLTLTTVPLSIGNFYNSNGVLGANGATDLYGHINELRIMKPKPYLVSVPIQAFSDS